MLIRADELHDETNPDVNCVFINFIGTSTIDNNDFDPVWETGSLLGTDSFHCEERRRRLLVPLNSFRMKPLENVNSLHIFYR